MKYNKIILVALAALTILNGCIKDTIDLDQIPDADRKLSIAGPIAKIHFTMGELIDEFDNDSIFTVADDGLISKLFKEEVLLDWEDLTLIEDIQYTYNFLPLSPNLLKATSNKVLIEKFKLNSTSTSRYDSTLLSNGQLDLNIILPQQVTSGTIDLVIPELKLSNGKPLSYKFTVTSTAKTFHETLNLNKAKISYSHSATNDSSYVTLNTNLNLNYTVGPGVPAPIQMTFSIVNMESELTFGYFGQTTVEEKGLAFSFDFDDVNGLSDKIEFKDARIELMTENFIGTPFSIEIDSMFFSTDKTTNPIELIIPDIFNITSPPFANPIVPVVQKFSINNTNSNIKAVMDTHPNYVICNVKATSNPQNTGIQNFLNQSNRLHTTVTLNFPFWFRTQEYERADTIDFDFNEMVDDPSTTEPIDLLALYLKFENSLPFEILADLYVTDINYGIIENLAPTGGFQIKSGVPNANDKVTAPTTSDIKIAVTQAQLLKFRDQEAKYLIVRTKAITYNNGTEYVKVYTENKLDIAVSFEIKGKISTK